MFCVSAGLLIDRDLAAASASGHFPLLVEWRVELEQRWRGRDPAMLLVLLAAGLSWQPGAGRHDPDRPQVCPLPPETRPLLEQLAAALDARLIEVEGPEVPRGLGRHDLLEAPVLLVASPRPSGQLLDAWLSREHPCQELSLWSPSGQEGRLQRRRYRGFRALEDGEAIDDRPPPAELLWGLQRRLDSGGNGRGGAAMLDPWLPLLLLPAVLAGLAVWQWSGRLAPGLLLLFVLWWCLGERPSPQERNRLWCLRQLLRLTQLWADLGLVERVRELLVEARPSGPDQPQLLQALQARRLDLELNRRRHDPWQRADLVDAQALFEDLQQQLRQAEQTLRRERRWLVLLSGGLGLSLTVALLLDQKQIDGLMLPAAALLVLFSLRQPLPLLPSPRRRRGIEALERPLTVLRRAQRSEQISSDPILRREVEQAVEVAGRELVDLVNDSFCTQAIFSLRRVT